MAEAGTHGPKRRLTKPQAGATVVIGAALFVGPWFIPSEQGSALQGVKAVVALAGFVVLCSGAYYRP